MPPWGEHEAHERTATTLIASLWPWVSVEAVSGLVEIPINLFYHLRRDDLAGQAVLFHRTSYLCKSATKVFVDGSHGFGCSRSQTLNYDKK
ncbi:hypothetical protein TX24_25830 [Pseudomonas lactis]|nr:MULTISPECIES: inovirus-type Gp2 protein [Pseudomonas]KRP75759.1 hypothetical protein TX24_25830 [Pseudomonas lactis]